MFDTVMNENSIDNDQYLLTSSLSYFHDGSGVLLSLTNDQLQNPNLAVMLENTQETLLIGMADCQDNHGIFEFDPQFNYLSDVLAQDGTITVALSSSAPGIRFAYTGEDIDFETSENNGTANASLELTGENYNQFHSIEMIAAEVNKDTDIEITVTSTYTDEFVSWTEFEVNEEHTFLLTILDSDSDALLG